MKTETRTTTAPANLETREDKSKKMTGYGAVFYDGSRETEYQLWDDMVERIMPGAFDRAMKEKDDVRGLFNHDPNQVLGRTSSGTMQLSIDKKGLRYEIDPAETTVSRDVQEHLKRGDVKGSSFSFIVTKQTWREEGEGKDHRTIREIQEVRLYDVGPVTFPAYEATEADLRSAAQAAKPKPAPTLNQNEIDRRQVVLAEVL